MCLFESRKGSRKKSRDGYKSKALNQKVRNRYSLKSITRESNLKGRVKRDKITTTMKSAA